MGRKKQTKNISIADINLPRLLYIAMNYFSPFPLQSQCSKGKDNFPILRYKDYLQLSKCKGNLLRSLRKDKFHKK